MVTWAVLDALFHHTQCSFFRLLTPSNTHLLRVLTTIKMSPHRCVKICMVQRNAVVSSLKISPLSGPITHPGSKHSKMCWCGWGSPGCHQHEIRVQVPPQFLFCPFHPPVLTIIANTALQGKHEPYSGKWRCSFTTPITTQVQLWNTGLCIQVMLAVKIKLTEQNWPAPPTSILFRKWLK
jgi:hypothetical protein